MTDIALDAIVQHVANGKFYKVRSVSKTRAVCRPCSRTGGLPPVGSRATAIEFKKSDLKPAQ